MFGCPPNRGNFTYDAAAYEQSLAAVRSFVTEILKPK